MVNRYSRIDNQSPVESRIKADSVPVGRSAHDCSHIHNGNTMFGLLAPVLTMEVVPNEDIDIDAAALLELRNPTTRQIFNSCRVFYHAYYNRLTDLWEGAKNWLDNGRSGKLELTRPNLIYRVTESDGHQSTTVDANTPMSLLNFFGMPPTSTHGSDLNIPPLMFFRSAFAWVDLSDSSLHTDSFESFSNVSDYFPADCAMAYQRNWRDFYCNKNLLQNNHYWFPDNEDHFILSYSATNCVAVNYESEDFDIGHGPQVPWQYVNLLGTGYTFDDLTAYQNFWKTTPEPNNPATTIVDEDTFYERAPNLAGIKFRQFRGDRFTTASPFPDLLRGVAPILDLYDSRFISLTRQDGVKIPVNAGAGTDGANLNLSFSGDSSSTLYRDGQSVKYGLIAPESSVTMSDIYTLETLTAFKRRMGMTNGDYNEMIESQYGVNPHVHDRQGTYIGGYYQDFAFSSVTQTSESSGTPLGTKAGQGVSSGSGSFGHFHTPDFGWIQIYMSVVPDVYYTMGKPRQFSKKSNLEMYFPLFNNLPAQGIRNDELYISGNSTTDATPFAYEDRYAEFKSFPNRVSGFMGLSTDDFRYDTSRVIARRFSSLPSLNSQFVTMLPENTDMSVFAVADEPPIDFSIGFNIRRVFPGPYTAVEGSLSAPLLNKA